ncbi:MAG TPA: sugar phosphate nucleotidyltransferase [Candidatus Acidoferrales bacterium]|nr:sugar phosphate nucleotidyltransferase [Candidatus Acidoferrales bacterium]
MKVIILCGGIGTRLKEETEFKPKPMVYVGNKPIIWHIMKHYALFGHNEFILALGYKADYIKEFFLNQKAFTTDFTLDTVTHKTKFYLKNRSENEIDDFKITFVDTGLDSLIGERLLRCKEYVKDEDTFMVTYGDGVSDLNINKLINFHKKQGTIGTVTGVHPRTKYGLIKIANNNIVEKFQEKPVLSDWVSGGYMVFNKKIFSYIRSDEMEIEALKKLIKKKQLSIYKHQGFWFAVDTYKELEDLNKIWNENPPWKLW